MRLVNGKSSTSLDTADRGLLYGDGLFETMAVIDGAVPLWDRHIQRLAAGCARLGFKGPGEDLLRAEADRLIRDQSRCVLKIIVTRGTGGLYRPPLTPRPTRILERRAWPDHPVAYWREGIELRTCHTRLAVGGPIAGLKHLNRLEQVLARAEWRGPEPEGLMYDAEDRVVEGTMTNLFLLRGGNLITPRLDLCGVAGVMRALVMETAAQYGLVVEEVRVEASRVLDADALFVTNAVIGIWPVKRYGSRDYAVNEDLRRLQRALEPVIGSRP